MSDTSPRIVLIANGDLRNPAYIRAQLRANDQIIAANGGSRLAFALNMVPDLVVGDRDSLPADVAEWLVANRVPVREHPTEKEETDLELALSEAIARKPRHLLLLGLMGNRTDHVLANFSLLARVAKHGIQGEVIINREHIYTVKKRFMLEGSAGTTLSLLPWGGNVHGITTSGLKWDLKNEDLHFGTARGISNIMLQKRAIIEVTQGLLLVVVQRRDVT